MNLISYALDPNVLLTAVATLAGTLIGGFITLVTTRRETKLSALKESEAKKSRDLLRAADQISAYHALETEYASDIAAKRGISARTIKTEYRNRVEEKGYTRPNWTEEQARDARETASNTAT